ncbi:MAG: AI-2E family transporter [Methylocystis sp.]|nr:AI-2E family transporter [Methylocystis sp.]
MSDRDLEAARGRTTGAQGPVLTLERQIALWVVGLGLFAAILYLLSSVLTPFVAGIVLGYLLDPVADRLQAAGLSRLGATLLILVAFVVLMTAVLVLIAPALSRQLAGFIDSLPGYLTTLQELVARLSEKLTSDFANGVLRKLGLATSNTPADAQRHLGDFAAEGAVWAGSFLKSLVSGGAALVNLVSLLVITPVVAFYILLDWDAMVASLDALIPPRHRDDVHDLVRDIDKALAGFLRGQSLVCLFLGLWYAVGLSLIGLNFGFLIGVAAGVLSFIPYVGSLTALVFSIIVAIVQGWPDWRLPATAIGVVSAGLFLDGNVLSPRLVGASVGLHPVWLMFALFAFGSLFGFVGVLIALPLSALALVAGRRLTAAYLDSALYRG